MVQIGWRSDNSKHINGWNKIGGTKITCRSEKVISGDFVSDLAGAACRNSRLYNTSHSSLEADHGANWRLPVTGSIDGEIGTGRAEKQSS